MNDDQKTMERKRQREEEDEIYMVKVENKKRKVNHIHIPIQDQTKIERKKERETNENDEKKKQMEIEQEIMQIKEQRDKDEEILLEESQIKAEKKRKMEEENEIDMIEDQKKKIFIPSRLTWKKDVIRREAHLKAQIDSRNRRRESSPEKNLLRHPSPTYSPDLEIIFEKLMPRRENVFYPTEYKYYVDCPRPNCADQFSDGMA